MKTKLRIPKGYRVLRVGEIRRRGDRFKKANGCWSKTSDYGSKVIRGVPCMNEYPEYAGIYIRKVASRA